MITKKDRKIIPWDCVENRFKKITSSNFRSDREGRIIEYAEVQTKHFRHTVINDVLGCCTGLDREEVEDKYLLFLECYYINPYIVSEMCVCIRVDFCDGTCEYVDEVVPLMMDPYNLFYLTEVPMNRKGYFTGRGAILIFDTFEELQDIDSITCYWYGLYPNKDNLKQQDGLLTKVTALVDFEEVSGSKVFRARNYAMPYCRLSKTEDDDLHPDFEKMVVDVPSLEYYQRASSTLCTRTCLSDKTFLYDFYTRKGETCSVGNIRNALDTMTEAVYDIFENKKLFGTLGYMRIDDYFVSEVITDDNYEKPYLYDKTYTPEELANIKHEYFSVWSESLKDNKTRLSVTEKQILERLENEQEAED